MTSKHPVIYLVFPDLGGAKAKALCHLARTGMRVNVLVSYSIILQKPKTRTRLQDLREASCLGYTMLDSGAYHIVYRGLDLPVNSYATGATTLREYVDTVVGPDIPGNPHATIQRLLEFRDIYPHEFIPTLQAGNGDPQGYLETLKAFTRHGIIEKAPTVDGQPLIGVGGLVGKPVNYTAKVIQAITRDCQCKLHLFGANLRALRGLARRHLLDQIHSIDTSGWLSEIRWRRRTIYKANNTLEANIKAIKGYLEKLANTLNHP